MPLPTKNVVNVEFSSNFSANYGFDCFSCSGIIPLIVFGDLNVILDFRNDSYLYLNMIISIESISDCFFAVNFSTDFIAFSNSMEAAFRVIYPESY